MGTVRTPLLVTAQWLKQQLGNPSPKLRVFDATWSPLAGGYPKYIEEHIPGSQHFDLNTCVDPKPTLARNLPESACLTEYVRSLGVDPDSHIIVYDRGSMTLSARLWWTFRAFGHNNISILNGGFKQWIAHAYPVKRGEHDVPDYKGSFEAKEKSEIITRFEELIEQVKSGKSQIADARHPKHFLGREPEPSPATVKALQGMNQPVPNTMHRGHIPGSKNILEDEFIDSNTNCFLPSAEITEVFNRHDIDLSKPLTTMCYNGHSAAFLCFASALSGKNDTSVYYGSWTEYGQLAPKELVNGSAEAG